MSTTDRLPKRGGVEIHLAPSRATGTSSIVRPTLAAARYGATLGRAITIAGLAAFAAGLTVGGIGSRLAMRLVTVLGDPADIGA